MHILRALVPMPNFKIAKQENDHSNAKEISFAFTYAICMYENENSLKKT